MKKSIVLVAVGIGLWCKILDGVSSKSVSVLDGPTVLHDSIAFQWGGHTFCYLILGKHGLFWSATAYNESDPTPTVLIGQYPRPGSALNCFVSTLRFTGVNVKSCNQPQMVRSPDGYIHVFIGVTYATDNPSFSPGKLYYFRSEKPEDISKLVDRTNLIPTEPYGDFHLRMNVGISPDGQRMALVVLAISEDGKVPFNTPVIFFGKKKGPDFVFQKPIRYAEPMALFYPQVAVTNDGVVIVGEVWDDKNVHPTRLIHLNWQGELLHREELPVNGDGDYFSFDLRPLDPKDWSKLILYYNKVPKDHGTCYHEFWEYDTKAKRIRLLRSIETEYSLSNPGKWIPVSDRLSLFINNPCMGQLNAWEGDLLGGGKVTRTAILGANPLENGYMATAYIFVPNILQGSVLSRSEVYVASDCFNRGKDPAKRGPCSFLLWRLSLSKE